MNRLVLIGNGFDLAHGLKTSYKDFINWYWENWGVKLLQSMSRTESDGLCTFKINDGIEAPYWAYVFGWYYQRNNPFVPWDPQRVVQIAKEDSKLCNFSMSPFLERINKSIETRDWVDIENEYYHLLTKYALLDESAGKVEELNRQLQYLKEQLIKYLGNIEKQDVDINESIKEKIYSPIKLDDISVSGKNIVKECVDSWMNQGESFVREKMHRYGWKVDDNIESIRYFRDKYSEGKIPFTDVPRSYLLPDAVMLLNFNYTIIVIWGSSTIYMGK